MHRYLACVLAVAAFEAYAAQGFMNGNRLYWQLTSPEVERKAFGASYVAGVHDAVSTLQSVQAVAERICAPYGSTPEELGEVVKEYMDKYPDRRHQSAAAIVVLALRDGFPCGAPPRNQPLDDELKPRRPLIPG
jgi:hypothetical protein